MNIAMFSDAYTPIKSGVVSAIQLEIRELEKLGHTVYLITVGKKQPDDNDRVLRVRSIRPPLFKTNQPFRLGLFERALVAKFLKDKEIDCVHTQTEFSIGWLGYYYARKAKLPFIHSFHTLWEDYKNVFFITKYFLPALVGRKYMTSFLSKPDILITPTQKSADYLRGLIPDAEINIVQNGIPFVPLANANRTQLRKELGIPVDAIVALFAGRITDEKRIIELYRVFKLALQEFPQLHLVLAGDGPRMSTIRSMVRSDGLHNQIHILGLVSLDRVAELNAIADITTTASLSETSNMSILEGVSSGLAVLVRNDPCFAGVLEDGKNGFVAVDELDMLEKLIRLVHEPKLLSQFSKENKKIAHKFSADYHVKNLVKAYKNLVSLNN